MRLFIWSELFICSGAINGLFRACRWGKDHRLRKRERMSYRASWNKSFEAKKERYTGSSICEIICLRQTAEFLPFPIRFSIFIHIFVHPRVKHLFWTESNKYLWTQTTNISISRGFASQTSVHPTQGNNRIELDSAWFYSTAFASFYGMVLPSSPILAWITESLSLFSTLQFLSMVLDKWPGHCFKPSYVKIFVVVPYYNMYSPYVLPSENDLRVFLFFCFSTSISVPFVTVLFIHRKA